MAVPNPSYQQPGTRVFQINQSVPAPAGQQIRSFITGGNAHLVRYTEASEKALGSLGLYNESQDTTYAYPNNVTGGVPDTDYTSVYMDNALLKYFSDASSSGTYFATVADTNNKIASSSFNLVSNGTSYPRDADLYDRDVKIGDIVRVRASVGGTPYTLWSAVQDILANEVSASIDSATSDTNNQADVVSDSATITQTGGANNCVRTAVSDAAYSGYDDGIEDTYTIEVTRSSTDGDPTTATLKVTSSSGQDNVASVTPEDYGSATSIGTRGLTVTFSVDGTCSDSISEDEYSADDLIEGQTWEVSVQQQYTAPTATKGGTYTGSQDRLYIIEVTTGGAWADSPKISVATADGTDSATPVTVSGAATAVPVGNYGVTVSFDEDGLVLGDKFYIQAHAASDGAYQTLVLSKNFPWASVSTAETEISLDLYIRESSMLVSEVNANNTSTLNWESSATGITLNEDMYVYNSEWTDGGTQLPLPVFSSSDLDYGEVFVTYRSWNPALTTELGTITDISELDTLIPGATTPDNPLKYGLSKALLLNNGIPVIYGAVTNPDNTSAWTRVLELVSNREDCYNMVPLTRSGAVYDLFEAHATTQSTAEKGRWRVVWRASTIEDQEKKISSSTSTDGETVLATISDNPTTSGTQYTYLQVPANNANFITNGVTAGDSVRYLFSTDSAGDDTYTEFTVDSVVNENTLILTTAHTEAISVARKIEIWHMRTENELASDTADVAKAISDRRVRFQALPYVEDSSGTIYGYFLAASYAALSSGIAPQQGITRYAISGYTSTSWSDQFSQEQLNLMSGNGCLVTVTNTEGSIFCRHAVTTADYSNVDDREEMIVRNHDSIAKFLQSSIDSYVGVVNVTPSMTSKLRTTMTNALDYLAVRNFTQKIGGQVIDWSNLRIEPSTVFADRYNISVTVETPTPANNFDIYLYV